MADTIRVNNKTARPLMLIGERRARFLIQPGENEVPSDIFQQALKSRTRGSEGEFNLLEAKREAGELEWDGDEGQAEASKPINELSERQALKVVKETFSAQQLDQYRAQDSRPKVQKAIDEQVKSMDAAAAKGKAEGKGMADVE
jgi:hypothetical protein